VALLVHAVFETVSDSEAVTADLERRTEAHPQFAVQTHRERNLDGSALPESATEVGQNTKIATTVGAGVGLLVGVVGGSTLDFAGFNAGTGAGIGLLFGVLVGSLSGLMAGARQPKAKLRELAAGLADGRVLVTVEVDDRAQAEVVEGLLGSAGGSAVGRC
jgi:hypothetical protein